MAIKARFAINLLENDRGELLLLKRSADRELGPGLWGFPAGHIEAGETPGQCALRELTEEIGPVHRITPVQCMGPIADSHYGGIYRIHLFHYHWHGGTVSLNHEHTEYAWVGREDYNNYPVMDGIDVDILYLGIWPREYLNEHKLAGSG